MVVSNDCLLIEALAGVTELDLVLSCEDKLEFTLGKPGYREDIFSDVVEGLQAVGDDLRAFARFYFAQVDALALYSNVPINSLNGVLEALWLEVLKHLFLPDSIEVVVHALFDVPNHQTRVMHSGVVVPSSKNTRINWVPSDRHAVPLVLDHAARHEHLLDLALANRVAQRDLRSGFHLFRLL